MVEFIPRPKQSEVLSYSGGYMGVSAVPGSGKTWTLSALASKIISGGILQPDQEVLIVTLVNSAVENFSVRVKGFIQSDGLPFQLGYRVRTLHSLANDIVRARPGLVGLSDDFQIIDERAAERVRKEVSTAWLKANPFALDTFLNSELDENENRREWVRGEHLPGLVSDIALGFIRYAKDNQITPPRLRVMVEKSQMPLFFAEMGLEIYEGYQRALNYRGMVDFDDLIRLALQALQMDRLFLERLQYQWPFILEDEAQDSSLLQENILRTLAGREGNWVRVGDPNQAIFETFTTADPNHLRDFIRGEADYRRELPNSGRSSVEIIALANYLIDWVTEDHPLVEVRDALSLPYILPTTEDDPQPNPVSYPGDIILVSEGFSPSEEIQYVVDSAVAWIDSNPERTAAILVPRNMKGFQIVDELRKRDIDPVDSLLRSSSTTRMAAGAIANILQYLSDPKSTRRLATVYRVWRREDRDDEELSKQLQVVSGLIENLGNAEDFLWPTDSESWFQELAELGFSEELLTHLEEFRALIRRWQGAVLLPIDQLVLTLAQDLFQNSTELAIAHKLALLLGRSMADHQDWRLPEFTEELAVIAKNERRFLGFSEEDLGFDPDEYAGRIVVSTMHKAKGLEWDRVFLMSVNNYDFPSGQTYDQYISERWFLRDGLNLQAEALAQLDALTNGKSDSWYSEGEGSAKARIDYVKERVRLLYVGITRAKSELIVTWNTGRKGELSAALPLVALNIFAREQGYDES